MGETTVFGPDVPAVAPAEVPTDGYLLDVREQDEWQAGHAPQAVHVPLGELNQRAGEIPRDRPVYVVCRSGGRSAQATQAMNDAGWQASNVTGGMHAWAESGLDMASADQDPPRVV